MIFKKNNDWSQNQSNKNFMNAPRSNTSTPSTTTQRREPEVTKSVSPSPATQNNYSTATMTPPVSPIATATARRTTGPATRNDQLRKLTVGRDISLQGEITTCDHLIVEGTVKATIKGGKILEITETGAFSGVVDIEQADIAGHFDGLLVVRGKLTIRPTATVTGQIQYNRLQVDTGATINGELSAMQSVQQNAPVNDEAALDDQTRLFGFTGINDEPGFLKASA